MVISLESLSEIRLQIINFKKKYYYFFIINCILLSFMFFLLFLSILYYPLPIPIFFTLVYASFSYFLILFFKLIEKSPFTINKFINSFKINLSKPLYYVTTFVLIGLLVLIAYYIIIPVEGNMVDVDDAIISAVQGFVEGINPYQEPIVPHTYHQGDYADINSNTNSNGILDTYNYLPVDLAFYSIGYILFSPFVEGLWFYLINVLIICLCVYLFAKHHSITYFQTLLLFFPSIVFGGLILNDIWLILFITLFFLWFDKFKYHKFYFLGGVTLLTLGFLTKMLLIFILPIFLLYYSKDWSLRIKYVLYSIILSLVIISFFDLRAVINSVFLFHSNLETRGNVAFVGGIIAIPLQWLELSWLYIPVFIVAFLIVLFSARYYSKTLEGKILYVSAIVILLLPSGNFLPFLFAIGLCGAFRVYSEQMKFSQNYIKVN